MCEFLLRQRVEISARKINGFTPLHEAVYHKVEETVLLLLEYGADANLENDELIILLKSCDDLRDHEEVRRVLN